MTECDFVGEIKRKFNDDFVFQYVFLALDLVTSQLSSKLENFFHLSKFYTLAVEQVVEKQTIKWPQINIFV